MNENEKQEVPASSKKKSKNPFEHIPGWMALAALGLMFLGSHSEVWAVGNVIFLAIMICTNLVITAVKEKDNGGA